jgi:hypothetical protein
LECLVFELPSWSATTSRNPKAGLLINYWRWTVLRAKEWFQKLMNGSENRSLECQVWKHHYALERGLTKFLGCEMLTRWHVNHFRVHAKIEEVNGKWLTCQTRNISRLF